MSASPLVTVVVPTFNRAYCLERTLRSALEQTHQRLDVIVVDDGSTDETPALLRRMELEDHRLRSITQANQGVVAARNTALRLATGDYIAFLDSDDVWLPWKIELQLACFRHVPDLGMVWSDMMAVDPCGEVISPMLLREMYTAYRRFVGSELFHSKWSLATVAPNLSGVPPGELRTGVIFSEMLFGSLVHTSTVMMSRDRLERVGEFDTQIGQAGEDYDFHLRTCREGAVGLVEVATIKYQTGLADRLTRPELGVMAAKGYVKAVARAIAEDRALITLSDAQLASIQGDAHLWLAEELLEQESEIEAREHLAQSLRHRLRMQPLMRWLRSYVPKELAMPLQTGYRAFQGVWWL